MKKFKKILSVFLALLFLMTSMPVVQFTAAPVVTTKTQKTENALPVLPDGYSFSGRTFIDEYDNIFYYIESEPSEYGLVDAYWIDEYGNRADEYDDSVVFADDSSDEEPVSFPSSYDARDYGYITPVEDQTGGTCWAHAAASCIETNAIKKGIVTSADISEYHTVYYSRNGYYEGVTDSANDGNVAESVSSILKAGGNASRAADAMLNFAGAASESRYPFSSTTVSGLASEMQNTFTYDEKYKHDIVLKDLITCTATNENIKQLILDYGAAYCSYYSDTGYYTNYYKNSSGTPTTYYYPTTHTTNHAITVVGWDDHFSASNFNENNQPSSDGAWLVKNSWGADWGNDDGYFWLSYEDQTLYSSVWAFETEPASDYENVYLYDGIGYGRSISSDASANVFTASTNEYLAKVSVGAKSTFDYTVKIYKNLPSDYTSPTDGTLAYTQTGNTNGERYIDITGSVEFTPGEIFSVVIEGRSAYAEGTGSDTLKYTSNSNESFYRTSDGVWHDSNADGYNNTCVRAVTKYLSAGIYTVKFICPGKYMEKRTAENGTVALPETEGYTWEFTYDGKAFDGTGVDRDMSVESHCYKTDGETSDSCVCTTEYKCIYCGKEMLPSVTVHQFTDTTTAPTASSPGFDRHLCTACGYVYKDAFTLYDGATGNIEDGYAWQIVDGVLSVAGSGSLPDFTQTENAPWYPDRYSVKSVVVGEDITRIGNYSFYELRNVVDMTLPSTLTEIGRYAFRSCVRLEEAVFPEHLKTIENGAFWDNSSLKDIQFNKELRTLGQHVFGYCYSLTEAVIPSGITSYGYCLYQNCENVRKITVEEGVTSLQTLILTCTKGKCQIEEIEIPSTVTSISPYVLSDLYTMKAVTVSPDNPNYCSVDGILFSKDRTSLYYYPSSKDGIYYNIPDDVSVIGSYAFNALQNLQFLDMSCAAVYLPIYAIRHNDSLTNIILPTGLTTLRDYSIYENKALSALYFPASITSVGANVVYTPKNATVPTIYTDSEDAAAVAFAQGCSYEYVATHTSHSFGTLAYGKDPDCVNGGETIYTCECGQFEYSTQPCTGIHTYEWVVDAQPTCTETGTKHQVCTVCAATASVGTVIPANGHTKIVTKQAKDATCTENGNTVEESCSVCGTVLTASTVIPSKGHTKSITKAAKEATCTETGYTAEESCSVCGIVLTESTVIPMKEHTKVISKPAKDATCTETGYSAEESCSVCGKILVAQTATDALGHSFTTYVSNGDATCTDDGTKTATCDRCDATDTIADTGSAKGHTEEIIPAVPATCTETGLTEGKKCSVCGKVLVARTVVPLKAHTKVISKPGKDATCMQTGYTAEESCSVCGKKLTESTVIPLKEHTKVISKPGKDATCTQTGYTAEESCSVCGKVLTESTVIPLKAHTKSISKPGKAATCTEAGYTAEESCAVCGVLLTASTAIPATGHTKVVSKKAKSATCTENGNTVEEKCSVCGIILTASTVIPATGHSYVISTVAPTCTEDGYTLHSCSVCGSSYKDEIVPATGHTDADGDEICDNCGANTNPAANCSCICHKTGFAGFIYKIVRLFWKLFKMKQTCECGAAHW